MKFYLKISYQISSLFVCLFGVLRWFRNLFGYISPFGPLYRLSGKTITSALPTDYKEPSESLSYRLSRKTTNFCTTYWLQGTEWVTRLPAFQENYQLLHYLLTTRNRVSHSVTVHDMLCSKLYRDVFYNCINFAFYHRNWILELLPLLIQSWQILSDFDETSFWMFINPLLNFLNGLVHLPFFETAHYQL